MMGNKVVGRRLVAVGLMLVAVAGTAQARARHGSWGATGTAGGNYGSHGAAGGVSVAGTQAPANQGQVAASGNYGSYGAAGGPRVYNTPGQTAPGYGVNQPANSSYYYARTTSNYGYYSPSNRPANAIAGVNRSASMLAYSNVVNQVQNANIRSHAAAKPQIPSTIGVLAYTQRQQPTAPSNEAVASASKEPKQPVADKPLETATSVSLTVPNNNSSNYIVSTPTAGNKQRPASTLTDRISLTQPDDRVLMILAVPQDSVVYLAGQRMTMTGSVRSFVSPTLQTGSEYVYEVKVEVVRNGQTKSAVHQQSVRAGDRVEISFRENFENLSVATR